MLLNQHNKEADDALRITAVILSWGIYGASVEWRRDDKGMTPEEFIKLAIPFIISGANF